jgi:hypothetical protein
VRHPEGWTPLRVEPGRVKLSVAAREPAAGAALPRNGGAVD